MDLQEFFVVGGEADTVVLFNRVDYFPGSRPGTFAGIAVPVAVIFRVKNGKITEWLDAPLILSAGRHGLASRAGAARPVPATGARIVAWISY